MLCGRPKGFAIYSIVDAILTAKTIDIVATYTSPILQNFFLKKNKNYLEQLINQLTSHYGRLHYFFKAFENILLTLDSLFNLLL